MIKCSKCNNIPSENDIIGWKCNSCGKAFKITKSKLHNIILKKAANPEKSYINCPSCKNSLDDGNENIIWKCSCGKVNMGKLKNFKEESESTSKRNLVKCPECEREGVSKNAEACPNCGYNIKAHFDKIRQEEARKEQIRKDAEIKKKAEMEAKKRQEERIKSVPPLKKPQLTAPIVTLGISVLLFLIGISELNTPASEVEWSIARGHGDPRFDGGVFVLCGIGLLCYGIYLFSKRMERYYLSKTNLEEYQRQVIQEQDAAIASAQAAAEARAREEASKPECPYCHSRNTTKITTTAKAVNTAMFGVLGQKRKYQWHCNKCRSDF